MPSNALSLFHVNYLITIKVNLLNHRKNTSRLTSPVTRYLPSGENDRAVMVFLFESREMLYILTFSMGRSHNNENLKVTFMFSESKYCTFKYVKKKNLFKSSAGIANLILHLLG